ncbi:MAG: alpha/beta fold hydrolase [Planctomycetota bacterium]
MDKLHTHVLNGRNVTYQLRGSGPPVLLLHAFPFSSRMWVGQLGSLAMKFTTAAVDFPGFGGSQALPEKSSTIEAFAEAAEAVAKKVNANEPWSVCGLSMGGYVAFEMVRRKKLTLRSLVLANTRAVLDTSAQREARLLMIEKVRTEGAAAVAELMLPKMLTPAAGRARRDRAKSWMLEAGQAGILGALNALLTRPDPEPALAHIHIPTLVIAGEHDPISPPAEMQAFAAKIQGSQYLQIHGAAHLSNYEKAPEFENAVKRFLTQL